MLESMLAVGAQIWTEEEDKAEKQRLLKTLKSGYNLMSEVAKKLSETFGLAGQNSGSQDASKTGSGSEDETNGTDD